MAKKRGGLAGVWDRNKKVIKKVAPIAAGFIPGVGPAVGAALGAAMGGLDRPGKSGIGLDIGGAIRGGLEGYGGAKLGQAAKGGLAKMFTASPLDKLTGAPQVGLTAGGPTSYGATGSFQPTLAGAAPSTGMLAGAAPSAGALTGAPAQGLMTQRPEWYGIDGARQARSSLGIYDLSPEEAIRSAGGKMQQPTLSKGAGMFKSGASSKDITDIGSKYVTPMDQPLSMKTQAMLGAPPSSLPREVPTGGLRKMASSAFGEGGYLERNERMLGGIAKGVGSVLGGRAEAGALESQTELARQKFEYEKEQQTAEQERRRRTAELLMPLFLQMQSQSRQPYGG